MKSVSLVVAINRGDWQIVLPNLTLNGWKPSVDGQAVELEAHVEDFGIQRVDGKFFEIGMMTAGYDRPMVLQNGVGCVAAIFHHDRLVVEQERFATDLDEKNFVVQNRLLRASADNLAKRGIPSGKLVGKDYLDSQRIIYKEEPNDFIAVAVENVPEKAKIELKNGKPESTGEMIPLETMTLKEFCKTQDGPGKVAVLDAIADALSEEEANELMLKVYQRLLAQQKAEANKQ